MKMFVLFDAYNWQTPREGQPGKFHHNRALRGDVIDVSDDEAARGLALGALSASALDSAKAETESGEPRAWGDEQLRGANADDLIAYVGQRPSEAERVQELENKRSRPRKTVLEAIERIIDARDVELERLADVADADAADAAERRTGHAPVNPDE